MAAKTVTTKLQSSHDSIRIRQNIASIYHVIRMSVAHSANFGENNTWHSVPRWHWMMLLDVTLIRARPTMTGQTNDDDTAATAVECQNMLTVFWLLMLLKDTSLHRIFEQSNKCL